MLPRNIGGDGTRDLGLGGRVTWSGLFDGSETIVVPLSEIRPNKATEFKKSLAKHHNKSGIPATPPWYGHFWQRCMV